MSVDVEHSPMAWALMPWQGSLGTTLLHVGSGSESGGGGGVKWNEVKMQELSRS